MAANTCETEISYLSEEDMLREPFAQLRRDKAYKMFCERKCESWPNIMGPPSYNPSYRAWIDRGAAQEFLDWVLATAPTYNIPIASAVITDW
jgi:hypothetical protein